MGRKKIQIFASLMLASSICAAGTSAKAAREMPMADLSRKLLGDAGAVMIDMDRPRDEQALEQIRFYSHATATGTEFGICRADWVTVGFDERGEVETLSSETRYGVAGDIYRPPGKWSDDEFDEICEAVRSTRTYFPAPDPQSALRLARYVDAIAGKGPSKSQNYLYTCTGLCASDRGDIRWLKLNQIDSSRAIDCPKASAELTSCYEVTIGKGEVGPFPKVFRISGSTFMNRVTVSKVEVDVGSTLE